MIYNLDNYKKLFDYEVIEVEGKEQKVPVVYEVLYKDNQGEFVPLLPMRNSYFRKQREAEEYVRDYLTEVYSTMIVPIYLERNEFPDTLNWKLSKFTGTWEFDEWV